MFDKECTGDDDWMDERVEHLFEILGPKPKTYLAKGGKTSVLSYWTLREWLPDQGFSSTGKPNKTLKFLYTRCTEYEKHEQDCHVAEAASAGKDEVVMLAEPSADCHAAQAVAYPAWMDQPGVYGGRNTSFNLVKLRGEQDDGKA